MRLKWLGFAAAGLALAGCATTLDTDSALVSAPFAIDASGRIIVRLSINDSAPRPFIVDTAASICALYAPFHDRLGVAAGGDEITVHGFAATRQRPSLHVVSVTLGAVQWRDVNMVSLPAPSAERSLPDPPVGILGNDLLADYGVAFSLRDGMVRLYAPELMRQRHYAGWANIPLTTGTPGTPAASVFFVDISIAGKSARAIFDLGSAVNIVNWQAADDVGLSLRDYPALRRAPVGGALDQTPSLPRFVAAHVATGPVEWREEVFSIADLAIFDTLALGDQPAALLGAPLFAQRDFVIDLAGRRLLVRTRGAEQEVTPTPPGDP